MKKIFSIIVLGSILLASCKKSFIELIPVSTVSVDVLYKTDKDFRDAIIGCYNPFRAQYQNFWLFGDLRSDDSKQEIPSNVSFFTVDNFTMASDANLLRDTWQRYFTIINLTNTVLAKIVDADPAIVVNKNQDIGEAKFLRALAYFDLVRIFGDVPMVTTPVSIDEAYKIRRTSVDSIYNQVIINDLLDAQSKLPVKYTGTDIGRATQGAAKSLLGKVYVTRKDFVNAEAKLQEVTTMGYSLLSKYNDLFNYSKDEHHSEYIFDIEYEQGISLGSSFTNTFIPNSAQMAAFYGVVGSRGEANSPTDALFAAFDTKDLRRDISVGKKGGYTDNNGNFVPLLATTSQSYTKKYLTPVIANNDGRANWKVIRYADVLLLYAESLNENDKTAQALVYLNQVRARAGLAAYVGLTKDDAREKIYLERRLELAFEGHRWFDLVRTGRALSTMQAFGMQPYMTVFPIPIGQIQIINDPNIFHQNPGY